MKQLRATFPAEWAFSTQAEIEDIVGQIFPEDLRFWPLKTFDFESYRLPGDYFALIMRDKMTGISSGGDMQPFSYKDHPSPVVSPATVSKWTDYLMNKLGVRYRDLVIVLPLRDSGGDVGTDSRLFSNDEKMMWREQLLQNVVLQSGFVSKRDKSLWNVFGEMLKTMETEGGETAASRAMIQAVLSMEASFRTPAFDTAYLQFVLLVGENKDDCGEKMGMHLLKLMELLEQ